MGIKSLVRGTHYWGLTANLKVVQAVTLSRSVRSPPLHRCWCPSTYTTRCSYLHFQPPMSYTSAVPRAIHGCNLSLSGKGNSSPCGWVSMVSLANSWCPLCPGASATGHVILACWPVLHMICPGVFCSTGGCHASGSGHSVAFC